MVVHYPRTVWKNSSYAEHEVTGKTYNKKKKIQADCRHNSWPCYKGVLNKLIVGTIAGSAIKVTISVL